MKLIFLDFDGVVVTAADYERLDEHQDINLVGPNADSVALLNQIIERTGAKVVISSSWRIGRALEELNRLLERADFKGEVVGRTPHSYDLQRGHEIAAYLRDNAPDCTGFVILDDDADMVHLMDWLVQTDGELGLVAADVERAVEVINRPYRVEVVR